MASGQARNSDDVQVEVCLACGSPTLERLRARTDGVWVLRCASCTMGVVERYPRDLGALYADDYYNNSGVAGPTGYSSYEVMAAHGTSWAAQLVRLLRPEGGRVLDVGCADGYLLDRLGPAFERSGIEVNSGMAKQCRARGIDVIGSDLLDPELAQRYAGRFDVVTAIAVLEHLPNLRDGLSRIRQLLQPGGVALIELPLLTGSPLDETWFSSSLEHVFYPTEAAIRRVCSAVFGTEPVGAEARVEGYASTWVGLLSADPDATAGLQELHRRAFDCPISELGVEEKAFRFLFDVVHLARPTLESVGLLAGLDSRWLRPELLTRIASLWGGAVQDVEQQRRVIAALEEARDFNALQVRNWQHQTDQQKVSIAALEEARDFYALQARNWQRQYELQRGESSGKTGGS